MTDAGGDGRWHRASRPAAPGAATHIRRAGVGDADAVGRFQVRAWEQTYRGIVPDAFLDARSVRSGIDRWAERIRSGVRQVFVAGSSDGSLLGVASATRASSVQEDLPDLELATLYVDPVAHGTGLASDLLEAATGGEDAHLLVFSVNMRARRFYRRHGFVPVGAPQLDPGTGLDEERWVRRSRRAG